MTAILKLVGINVENPATMHKILRIWAKVKTAMWSTFRFFLLFGLCFVLLYPLIYMLSMSFKPIVEIYDPSVIWVPKHPTMQNMIDVWGIMKYPDAFWTSIKVNVVSSLIQIVTCALAGYGFARFKFKGKGIMFALLIFAIIVPPQMTVIPMYLQFQNFTFFGFGEIGRLFTGTAWSTKLLDTYWTFYLPAIFGVGLNASLFIYIFKQFFTGLPKELEDAASIDGCGFFATFVRIMIPNAGSVFLTTIILSIVWYWNDFTMGSMYFTNHKTVMTALVELRAGMFSLDLASDPFRHLTRMQAGSLLAITPMVIMYMILQKYFVAGVERSGIVG